MAYVLALNDLLRPADARVGKGRRQDIAGVGFLTWLRDPGTSMPWTSWNGPTPKKSRPCSKFDPRADPDPNRFYLVGVSGNGARLRVRYWVTESLPRIKENLKNWHEQLRVSYPWDDRCRPGYVLLAIARYATRSRTAKIRRLTTPLPCFAVASKALRSLWVTGCCSPRSTGFATPATAPALRTRRAIRCRCNGCESRWA